MTFTPAQWAAIDHRLDVLDDSRDDLFPDADPRTFERILRIIQAHDLKYALAYDRALTLEILRDCVEGSLWVAMHDNEFYLGSRQSKAAHRTLCAIAEKLQPLLGTQLTVPNC